MRHAIVIEKALAIYVAYVPDLRGCVANGTAVDETETLIRESMTFHIEVCKPMCRPSHPPRARWNILKSWSDVEDFFLHKKPYF